MRRGPFALVLFLAFGATLGCNQPRSVEAPPLAPQLDQPALAIPADLDLVVRLDLKRLRAVLGLEGGALLDALTRGAPPDLPDRDTAGLTRRLFARADTVWIGARPGLSPELTDSVVVLRGDFSEQVPSALGGMPAWRAAEDLGGAVRRFERAAPALRSAPALLYVRGTDVVVISSIAEIDALERTVEQGKFDDGVRAPETGMVAFAARLADLLRRISERAPTLAGMLEGAERIEGSLDHATRQIRVRIDVHFANGERAKESATALRGLFEALAGAGRAWLKAVRIDALGGDLSMKLDLDDAQVGPVLRCLQADC
jgi:hypothetical protein